MSPGYARKQAILTALQEEGIEDGYIDEQLSDSISAQRE